MCIANSRATTLKSFFFLSHIIDMLIKERALGSSPEKQSQQDVCVQQEIYYENWLMHLWKPANQYHAFPASSWRTKKASGIIYSESEASEWRANDTSPNPKAHVPGALKSKGRRRWLVLQLQQGESEFSFLYLSVSFGHSMDRLMPIHLGDRCTQLPESNASLSQKHPHRHTPRCFPTHLVIP